jgi:hypothetical protein
MRGYFDPQVQEAEALAASGRLQTACQGTEASSLEDLVDAYNTAAKTTRSSAADPYRGNRYASSLPPLSLTFKTR